MPIDPRDDLDLDTEPREIDVPIDLEAAFDDEARAAFERMSYTHRREYADWIEEAKRAETRARRVAKAVGMHTWRFRRWYRGCVHYRFQCAPVLNFRSTGETGKERCWPDRS